MQSIPHSAIVKCAMFVSLLSLSSLSAQAQTSIRVEFTASGECVVGTSGPNGRANVTYPRRTPELRCAIPSLAEPPSGGDVDLEVMLPPGLARPAGAFPQLQWSLRDGRWVGAARLDGAPAFVRIPPQTGRVRWRTRVLDALVLTVTALAIGWSIARGRAS